MNDTMSTNTRISYSIIYNNSTYFSGMPGTSQFLFSGCKFDNNIFDPMQNPVPAGNMAKDPLLNLTYHLSDNSPAVDQVALDLLPPVGTLPPGTPLFPARDIDLHER